MLGANDTSTNALRYIVMSIMTPEWYQGFAFNDTLLYPNANLSDWHDKYMKFIERNHYAADKFLDEFLTKTSSSCEEMIRGCYMAGQPIANCCSMSRPVTTDYGKCFQFDHGFANVTMFRMSGAQYGMEIIADLNVADSIHELIRDKWDVGLRFAIHDEAIRSPLLNIGGSSVPPGSKAYASIDMLSVNMLSADEWGRGCNTKWPTPNLNKSDRFFNALVGDAFANCNNHGYCRTTATSTTTRKIASRIASPTCTPIWSVACRCAIVCSTIRRSAWAPIWPTPHA